MGPEFHKSVPDLRSKGSVDASDPSSIQSVAFSKLIKCLVVNSFNLVIN